MTKLVHELSRLDSNWVSLRMQVCGSDSRDVRLRSEHRASLQRNRLSGPVNDDGQHYNAQCRTGASAEVMLDPLFDVCICLNSSFAAAAAEDLALDGRNQAKDGADMLLLREFFRKRETLGDLAIVRLAVSP